MRQGNDATGTNQRETSSTGTHASVVRVAVMSAGSLLLLLPLLFLLNIGASAADSKPIAAQSAYVDATTDPAAGAADCTTASIVPVSEC